MHKGVVSRTCLVTSAEMFLASAVNTALSVFDLMVQLIRARQPAVLPDLIKIKSPNEQRTSLAVLRMQHEQTTPSTVHLRNLDQSPFLG